MIIGYSTYAAQKVDIFEALQRIRSIGYESIEIAIGDDWPTAPQKLDPAARLKLRETIRDLDLGPPYIFGPVSTCARDADRPPMLDLFAANCTLANDLNFGESPAVVTTTVSGPLKDWDADRDQIRKDLLELAAIASEHYTILAVEPHGGGAFDTPEKAAWIMEKTGHPSLKLHFDHSHFHVQGIPLQRAADLCLPHTVHLHIKDGHMKDGKVQFQLPGEGTLDLVEYCSVLKAARCNVPVGAEVSAQIWMRPDYDPWEAAEFCYDALDSARQVASAT